MANAFNQFLNRLFGAAKTSTTSSKKVPSANIGTNIVAPPITAPVITPAADINVVTNAVTNTAINSADTASTAAPDSPVTAALDSEEQIALPPESIIVVEKKIFQAWKPLLPIDTHFFDWIMGYPNAGGSSDIEQKVLQELYGLLASDMNDAIVVPRMPTVIPQLMNSLRSKTASTQELTRHIVKDVVLVGEVINAVNSAVYNPIDRVNNLEKAVMILGEDGLRLLIAKVAFRPIINLTAGQYTRRAAPHIWNQSEKCAIACHHLAPDFGLDPFQSFLTGLMKNIGMIIAFRLLDQVCEEEKFKYSRGFHMAFSSVAATLSYRVAQRWGFPPFVIQALQQQAGGSKPIDWSPLGHLLHTADLMSKMRVLVNHAQLRSNDKNLRAGLDEHAVECYNTLNEIPLFDPIGIQQRAEQSREKIS